MSMRVKKAGAVGLAAGILAAGGSAGVVLAEDASTDNNEPQNPAEDTVEVTEPDDIVVEDEDETTADETTTDETVTEDETAADETVAEDETVADETVAGGTAGDVVTPAAPGGETVASGGGYVDEAPSVALDYKVTYYANNTLPGTVLDEETGEWVVETIAPLSVVTFAMGEFGYAVDIDELVEEGAEPPTKEGCVFTGWSEAPDAVEVDFEVGEELYGDEDSVLYAVWTPQDQAVFTISYFDGDEQLNSYDADVQPEYGYGEEADVSYPWGVEKEAIYFAGWSTDPNATEPEFTYNETAPRVTMTKSLRLFAVWLPIE